MLWRLEPLNWPNVERIIVRDADSRPSLREALAVSEWIRENTILHIMRDHPYHRPKIMGGMFGLRQDPLIRNINWEYEADEFYRNSGEDADDQFFLEKALYYRCKNSRTVHDEIHRYEPEARDYPLSWPANGSFIGEYVCPESPLRS